jgi:endonuclease I
MFRQVKCKQERLEMKKFNLSHLNTFFSFILIFALVAAIPGFSQNQVLSADELSQLIENEKNKISLDLDSMAKKYNIKEFEIISLNENISRLIDTVYNVSAVKSPVLSGQNKDEFSGLSDKDLIRAIKNKYGKHVDLGYKPAKVKMFGEIDNHNGIIRCVYTGRTVKSSYPANNDMNCEHTWPQSKGAVGAAKGDLHHLFPTDSKSNSRRSNYPFGYVKNIKWQEGGSKLCSSKVFEPRDDHKGNTARAMFYFAAVYSKAIDADQEKALKEWHLLDPVDQAEIDRNSAVEKYQKNRNPFIDMPELVSRISDF